jgi:P4 family phage/plasmid primase-like protien
MKREVRGPHFEYFVGKLEAAGARYFSGDDWFCPTHEDGNRGSLGVREHVDGSILMHCMGGCSNKEVMEASGLKFPSDFYPKKVQRYIYTDGEGNKLYCVIRYYKGSVKRLVHKVFEPSHPKADAKGFAAYTGCMRGVERVLFRLPRVLEAAERGKVVYVVGGEKDARAIGEHWGEVGTTNSGGEGQKWLPEFTEQLRGCSEVVIIPDRDKDGYKHAAEVYDALVVAGVRARIGFSRVGLPKSDASDHIMDGGTPEDLVWTAREDLETVADLIQFEDTDGGNADRIEAMFGTRVRFVHLQKKWLMWDGRRWSPDEPAVRRMVREVSREFADQCSAELAQAGSEEAKAHWKKRLAFARSLNNAPKAKQALEMAQNVASLSTQPEDYDRNTWTFNVANGTVDLRTGKLSPHNRTDLIRKISKVTFDRSARCPEFDRFIRRVVPSSKIRKFLCLYIGMSLTGQMDEHIFPVMYGKGRNGKSTFIRVIMDLFGEYGQSLPSEIFRAKPFGGGIPNDVARLAGARLAMASEFPEGTKVNEDLLKRLTGGDPIVARFLNQEFFEFYSQAKFILATNHKPEFRGTDDGVWRRVRLVPFTVKIPREDIDKSLGDKLRLELPGILNWAVRGCLAWAREGLYIAPEMEALTEEYREESDLIGQFLTEKTEPGEEEECMATVLYTEFQSWMQDQGAKPWTQNSFGRNIGDRPGIERTKHPQNRRVMYKGIAIRDETLRG